MKQRIKYKNEDLGNTRVVDDFLPTPEQLALKEEKVKGNCSGSRPKAGGYLRVIGGMPVLGVWARITRC